MLFLGNLNWFFSLPLLPIYFFFLNKYNELTFEDIHFFSNVNAGLEPKHLGRTLSEMHPYLQKMVSYINKFSCSVFGVFISFYMHHLVCLP